MFAADAHLHAGTGAAAQFFGHLHELALAVLVDIVRSAIKLDKVDAILKGLDDATHELTRHSMCRKKINAQRILLRMYDFADSHQNAGELVIMLNRYYSLLNSELNVRRKWRPRAAIGKEEVPVLISMLTHLAYNNPRVYPQFTAILSLLLSRLSDEKKRIFIDKVRSKFSDLPNTAFWIFGSNEYIQRLDTKMIFQHFYANWSEGKQFLFGIQIGLIPI